MGISSGGGGANTGEIKAFAGGVIPAGWLECGGQQVSRVTFSALFLVISTTYGVGDGLNTFNLPDLRGRSLFGKDNMSGTAANRLTAIGGGVDGATLGAVGGGEAVTLSEAQMPSHAHVQNAHNHGQDAHNHAQNAHSHTLAAVGTGASSITSAGTGSTALIQSLRTTDAPAAVNQAAAATNQAATATNQGTGASAAHQNMPPAIVTFMIIKT